MYEQKVTRKIWIAGVVTVFVGLIGGLSWYCYADRGSLVDFVYERDAREVLEIFEKDRYWLTSTPSYDADYMLKTHSPNKNVLYYGKLQIKVLREQGAVAGFTCYYMKPGDIGFILFVAVAERFRNKGYAKKIVRYVINQFKHLGAKRINMLTRDTNYPAQRAYESVGFTQTLHDNDGYVYYSYILN